MVRAQIFNDGSANFFNASGVNTVAIDALNGQVMLETSEEHKHGSNPVFVPSRRPESQRQ